MTVPTPPTTTHPNPDDLIENWAANLESEDVTLAPFMLERSAPAAASPSADDRASADPRAARLRTLIARARGKRIAIIL
jgi:hypothetical protein